MKQSNDYSMNSHRTARIIEFSLIALNGAGIVWLLVTWADLGSITGEFDVEDLYDRVFSTFCIGK